MYDIKNQSTHSDPWRYFSVPGHYVTSRPNNSLSPLQLYKQLNESQQLSLAIPCSPNPIISPPALLTKEIHPNLFTQTSTPLQFYKKLREARVRYIESLHIR